MEEPAEETVAGRSELGDAGEERAHEMSATDGEDSRVPAAPDVTYDATLLEQHQSETTAGGEGGGERGARTSGTAKEKAVRFKEEVTGLEEDPPIARGEEDKKEKEEEEKDEWMDILGTGDLKKKVRYCKCRALDQLTSTLAVSFSRDKLCNLAQRKHSQTACPTQYKYPPSTKFRRIKRLQTVHKFENFSSLKVSD